MRRELNYSNMRWHLEKRILNMVEEKNCWEVINQSSLSSNIEQISTTGEWVRERDGNGEGNWRVCVWKGKLQIIKDGRRKKAAVMAYFSVTIDVSDSINAGRGKYLLMNCKSHEIKVFDKILFDNNGFYTRMNFIFYGLMRD